MTSHNLLQTNSPGRIILDAFLTLYFFKACYLQGAKTCNILLFSILKKNKARISFTMIVDKQKNMPSPIGEGWVRDINHSLVIYTVPHHYAPAPARIGSVSFFPPVPFYVC